MFKKRLLAVGIAGVMAATSIGGGNITVYATGEDESIDSAELDALVEDGEDDDSNTDEASLDESADDEASDAGENSADEDVSADEHVDGEPGNPEGETEQTEELDEEAEEDEGLLLDEDIELTTGIEKTADMVYWVKFYPGDGKLISSLDFGDDVSEWEYDVDTGVMTAHVPATVTMLKSVKYALVVPDGSKEFAGWYLDEDYSEKADFIEGMAIESDMDLYAKFDESESYSEDDFIVSDTEPIAGDSIDRGGLPWLEELAEDESSYLPDMDEEVGSDDFAYDEPVDDKPSDYEPVLDDSDYDKPDLDVPASGGPAFDGPASDEPIEVADAAPQIEYISLKDAKLSGQIPDQNYRDNGGAPQSLGGDVVKLFKEGAITVSIGSDKLQYVDDNDAASITENGYYFTVSDPSENDSDVNRYIGSENYVTLRPTDAPKYNMVEGEMKVPFTIKGTELVVKSVNSTLPYDGAPVLVYTGRDDNGDGIPDVNNDETLRRIGGVITDSDGNALSGDRYTITSVNDSADMGTVLVAFEGKAERGVSGRVTQNIKIVSRQLAKSDVTVSFTDKKLNASSVPLVNGKATPAVTVHLNSNGNELVKDKDYSVTYADNDGAGKTGKISVKFAGNYSGTLSNILTFIVAKAVLSKDTIAASAADKRYSIFSWSNNFKSTPVLEYNGTELKLSTDYVYVDQPKYYYAEDYVKRNFFGRVTLTRKAGTQIPDSDTVTSGAVIKCTFSVVPSSTTKTYTAAKNSKGSYVPISFTVTYRMK